MPTRAELRRIRRTERRMRTVLPRVVRRVVNGRVSQPGWLPRRLLTLVSADVDPDAGVGAVLLVRRPGSAQAETHTVLIERCGASWRQVGGGGASGAEAPAEGLAAGRPGPVGVIELASGTGTLSYAYRLQHGHPDFARTVPWVGCDELRVAAEVDHVLCGGRRVEVPGHGRLVVAWTSPATGRGGRRPLLVAVGGDGSELGRIGPSPGATDRRAAEIPQPEREPVNAPVRALEPAGRRTPGRRTSGRRGRGARRSQ